jgi:hypothetical protein
MPPKTDEIDFRRLAREVRRLANILQGTMSLEGQGLSQAEMRKIKRRVMRRVINQASRSHDYQPQ